MIDEAGRFGGRTADRAPRGAIRRPIAGLLLALAGVAALLLLASANAMAAAPAWGLESAPTPAPVPITAPVNQVETVTVKGESGHRPNAGRLSLLFSNDLTGESAEAKALPYTASAAEVQTQLEALKIIGAGNVKVTGGPLKSGTETEWTYTITFVNGLGGYELEESIELEEVAATAAEEEKIENAGGTVEEGEAEASQLTLGGRDTVEYTLTPLNTGTTATSGTITVTDTLPANLTTKKTPEGTGWTCTPGGQGNTTITCTSTTAVAAGAKGSALWIEAYVDTASAKPGEVLVNHTTVSGGGPSSAEAVDSDLISNTTPAVLTGAASALEPNSASLSGTVDPEGKTVTSCFFEYGTSAAYDATVPCAALPGSGTSVVAVSAAIGGLKAMTTYHFRIVANGSAGTQINSYGEDDSFTTTSAPVALTSGASAVTQTGATLSGTVNPNGLQLTSCTLEYGPTSAYGASVPCSPQPGSGEGVVPVSAQVAGLSPDTIYHFRVRAESASANGEGEDRSFQTLPSMPTVVTAGASVVTSSSATLSGSVDPNGGQVEECLLEYGTSTSYGSGVACSPSPGSGTSAVAVSGAISGLTANTTYHFRITATSTGGTSHGSDAVVQTPASSAPEPTVQSPGSVAPIHTNVLPAATDAELTGAVLTASPSGVIAAKVSCPAAEGGGCVGTITLRTVTAVRAGRAKAAVLTLATGAFRLAGGHSATVALHLSGKARTLLARSRTLRALAIVSAHDSAGASHTAQRTVTVRLARAAPTKH